jgi:hypothetical protein
VGVLKEIALLPLAPVRGTVWVAEQIAEEADRRLYDENNIKREMVQLEIDSEEGRISEEERNAKEDELLERLAVARQRKTEEQFPAEAEEQPPIEEGEEVEPITEMRSDDG